MDRSATYDLLLVFHSNYGPVCHRLRDKWQYLLNFLTPVHITSPLRRRYMHCPLYAMSLWNFVTAVGFRKPE